MTFFFLRFIYLFGCAESLLLHTGFLELQRPRRLFIHGLLDEAAPRAVRRGLQVLQQLQLLGSGAQAQGS